MSFLSLEFALFFPAVCLLYFSSPFRFRWMVLLPASYLFYMAWNPWYILLILFSTIVDYLIALKLERTNHQLARRLLLSLSICTNLGLLFFFKYHNWFAESVNEIFVSTLIPLNHVLLPVGISFYTFQTMAYTIDVYRGKQKCEKHLGYFATYVAFFPQLVAGPIERPQNLLPELKKESRLDYQRMTSGLQLIAWGLFKKAVVADRLATLVDPVYANPGEFGSLVVIATIAFGIQIYCDFSGYSDIAIGSAEIMGIRLMKNFRAPYRAVSLQDFWRRWHISLSTWFKDYLYKPLISQTEGIKLHSILIASVVFIVSGVWHGAAWTFVVWGVVHAIMYSVGRLTTDYRSSFFNKIFRNRFSTSRRIVSVICTFMMVQFAWIFFRADSLKDASKVLQHIPQGILILLNPNLLLENLETIGWNLNYLIVALFGLSVIYFVHEIQGKHETARSWLASKPWLVRHCIYQGLIWSFLLLGEFGRPQFIYFQF
jgi:alginate O-acetyltransferase complex protein AlgI